MDSPPSPDTLIQWHHRGTITFVNTLTKNVHDPYIREEIMSDCLLALVKCAQGWESYCERKGFSPLDTQYFWLYLSRRLRGTVKDYWRERDPLSRSDRDLAKKTGIEATRPVWNLRQPLVCDLTVDIATADHEQPADSTILVRAATEIAVKTFRSFTIAEQAAIVCRLSAPYAEWGYLWRGAASSDSENNGRAHRATYALSYNAAPDVCINGIRAIRESVAAILDAPPLDYPATHKVAAERLAAWTPSDEFLKYVGGDVGMFIESFVETLDSEPSLLFEILKMARPRVSAAASDSELDKALTVV